MKRKRLTQIFPWLLPLRVKQKTACFYAAMNLDGNFYAKEQGESLLPHLLFETGCPLYNRETGFDMIYQENKVFNLKLAAATLDRILIKPQETFSFWLLVRDADREIPYKDGLTVIDGELTTAPGGGMCQMSNLLFWAFLHTPLTIVERRGHAVKDFPEPPSDAPIGVDATVSEGWVDLKVKNETAATFQIDLNFDEEQIIARIYTDIDEGHTYEIVNGEPFYYTKNHKIYEEVDVRQRVMDREHGECVAFKRLYRNLCQIGYELPPGTVIIKEGEKGRDDHGYHEYDTNKNYGLRL
ncbi:MAG TPA: glycopeptide resistance accessory protein VanW [Clostridiales bacterium]|nr:glycopeptide resistance accessory protein VanW [Clostridiales bacterium]